MSLIRPAVAFICVAFLLLLLPWTAVAQPGGGGGVSVTPDGATTPDRQTNSGPHTESFTVKNTGSSSDYFYIGCSGLSGVTCTGISPDEVSLGAGQQTTVYATYNVGGTAGTGRLNASAFSEQTMASDGGYYNVPIVGLDAPEVDWSPYNADNQDMSRCAVSCFAATYAHSTVPYFSLDTPRSITLVYHGDRVDPKPFIHVDARYTGGSQPDAFRLQVKKANGQFITFLTGETTLRFSTSSSWVRLAGQFNAASNGMASTGVYDITIIVGAEYAGGNGETTLDTKLIVVNENGSPVARGWTIAGVQRAYTQADSSVLITEGDGSAVYFERWGSSFIAPDGEFSELYTYGSGYRRLYPDSTDVRFNSSGYMDKVYDPFNKHTTFFYGSGKLTRVMDPKWKSIYLDYDSNGLDSIRAAVGTPNRVTQVTVSSAGLLTQITDPDGVSTTFGYSSNRLSTITDRRGNTTTLAYDADSHKLRTITSPAVPVYDQGTISLKDSLASWQQVGVPYSATSGTPFTSVLRDQVKGSVTSPGGYTTSFTVNKWGQPKVTTDALGRNTTASYSSDGLPYNITYPSGAWEQYTYNGDGLPLTTRVSGGTTTNIRYAAWALPDSIWGTGQPGIRLSVSSGKINWERVGAGGGSTGYTTYYSYDGYGRVTQVTDPEGHLVARTWYSGTNGNRSKDSLPGGRVTTHGYDAYGRRKWTDPPDLPRDSVQYDVLNRVIKSFNGVYSTPTQMQYDNLFLTKVTDAKGQQYQFTYNALGWLTQRKDPQNRSDTYQYTKDGELRRWTNRRGQHTDYLHDALHRQVKKYGTYTVTDSIHYSSNDRVITAIGPVSTETTYLNLRGQPDSVKVVMAGRTYKRRYTYTSAGLLEKIWGFSGTSTAFREREYRYRTARGTLDSLRLGSGWTKLQYNNDLLVNKIILPGGDQVSRSYTSIHGVTAITPSAGHKGTTGSQMGYDEAGRMTSRINWTYTKMNAYGYDDLSRLVADSFLTIPEDDWCDSDPDYGFECDGVTLDSLHSFSYDQVGNRSDHSGAYATGNRITAFDGCSYQTDNDGNVTLRDCATDVRFHWTSDSRLAAFKVVGGDSVDFHYDAYGRLARRSVNGSVQNYYLWDRSNLLGELNSSGEKHAEYSYYPGLDKLHAMVVGTTPYYAHTDGLGNVIALAAQNQSLKRTYTYDEWGELIAGSDNLPFSNKDRARFKGALWMGPQADLYYMRARWYEPFTGRFLSEDPIGLDGGVNTYLFAGANPIGSRDPSGLDPEDCDGTSPINGECVVKLPGVQVFDNGGGGPSFGPLPVFPWSRQLRPVFPEWIIPVWLWGKLTRWAGQGNVTQDKDGNEYACPVGLSWPVGNRDAVTSHFNPKRMHPKLLVVLPHLGMDIRAIAWTPVFSALPGGVTTRAGPYGNYGNFVSLLHGNGWTTQYGHLAAVMVGHGMVGFAGSTGLSTAPHVHFELIAPGGQHVNPLPCLP